MHAGHRVAHGARALRADPQQIAVGRLVVARGAAARLHRGDVDALVHSETLRDMRGRLHHALDLLGRYLVGIGREARPVDRDVARRLGPHLRRARLHRVAQIDHRVARLVIDLDRLGAVLRRREVSPITMATASPMWRTRSSRQRRPDRHDQLGAAAAGHRRVLRQIADLAALMSAAVSTATTPLIASAALDVDRLDVGAGMRRAHESRHRSGPAAGRRPCSGPCRAGDSRPRRGSCAGVARSWCPCRLGLSREGG